MTGIPEKQVVGVACRHMTLRAWKASPSEFAAYSTVLFMYRLGL